MLDKIWEETLARISKLELQVVNIESFIVSGVNDEEEPDQENKPDPAQST